MNTARPYSHHSIAVKRRKLNESKTLPDRKYNHNMGSQGTVKNENSLGENTIQPTLTTTTPEVESEEITLAKIPVAKKPLPNLLTTTNYSSLKSASKRKRVAVDPNSLFLPSCSSGNQEQKLNSPVVDKPATTQTS